MGHTQMTRKLASIQKIEEVRSIENADLVEYYRVLGWWIVDKKDSHKVGDKVVYVEIDSVLPEKPEFEFLRPKKFRIKTIKIRGVVSQGIIFSTDILPKGTYNIDDDVTDIIGVEKYDPSKAFERAEQEALKNSSQSKFRNFMFKYFPFVAKKIYLKDAIVKYHWPEGVPVTDETRVQILQNLLTQYKGRAFYVTEKVDGSSITVYYIDKVFGICSREVNYGSGKRGHNHYIDTANKYNLGEILPAYCKKNKRNLALQGELLGPKIQGNKYKLEENRIMFFSVFDADKMEYLSGKEARQIISDLGLTFVPIVEESYILTDNIDELIEKSKGKSQLNNKVQREGLVFRLVQPEFNKHVSFKAVNPNFLLKYDE